MRVALGDISSQAANVVTFGASGAISDILNDTSVTSDAGIRQIPKWCSWMPFSDYYATCQPYSNAELSAMTTAQLQKIAAVNPDLAAQGAAAASAAQTAAEVNSPADTCERNAAINHPSLSALLGPKVVCGMGGGGTQGEPSYYPYIVIGAIAVAVAYGLGGMRGR